MRGTPTGIRAALGAAATLALTAAGIGAVAPTVQADTTSPYVLPLKVSGNKIVDSSTPEQTVVLNGIHRDGPEIAPDSNHQPHFPSTSEITAIGAGQWHANVVRVPVSSPLWMANCPLISSSSTAYRASVDAVISTITQQGMVALLDLHETAPNCRNPARHYMPDPDVPAFWQNAAQHYAGNPGVAFELFNEPNHVSDDVWLRGTTPTAPIKECEAGKPTCKVTQLPYQAIGMQRLYDTVAAAAPNHLIIADGNNTASTVPATLVDTHGGGIVYGVHPYTCTNPATCDPAVSNQRVSDAYLLPWQVLARDYPVLVTEVGWPVYASWGAAYVDGANFYSTTIQFLQAQRPPWGIIGFAFDGSQYGSYDLVTDTEWHPNSTGQPLFNLFHTVQPPP